MSRLDFSARMASSRLPPRGWGLLVSLKRLSSTSISDSRKRTSILCLDLSLLIDLLISGKKIISRISMPMAMLCIAELEEIVVIRESIKETGRLSTQKNPESSSDLRATVLPEPDRPVMTTTRGEACLSCEDNLPADALLTLLTRLFNWLYKSKIAVPPLVDDVDFTAYVVLKDKKVFVQKLHLHRGLIRVHGFQFKAFVFYNYAAFM